ncbi:MAG: hypothetical protein N3A66_02995 [Planctomycetota bacterium]|nr:hypothetical protein [Planctomycetota bacterium]
MTLTTPDGSLKMSQPPLSSPLPPPRAPRWLWLLFLLTPTLIWHCWRSPFIRFDDIFHILENPLLDLRVPWYRAFGPPPEESYYYPFTLFSLRFDRWLWESLLQAWVGAEPWATGIRTGNLILHLASAFLVHSIIRALGASPLVSIFCALAFALHPTAVESTAWCVERKNVLAAFLGLAGWRLYLAAIAGWQRALAALLYLMAVFSKLSALGLLPAIALWEILFRGPAICAAPSGWQKIREALAIGFRILPWATAGAAAIAAAIPVGSHLLLPPPGGTIATALLTDGLILGRYIWNFLWPAGLSTHYAIAPTLSPLEPLWLRWTGLFCLLAIVSLLLTSPQQRRLCGFAWLWFIGGLGPNLNLVGINDLMHDRFAYLSAPAFWLAMGLACQGLARYLGDDDLGRRYAPVLIFLLSLFWAKESYQRSYLYQDTAFLFTDTVAKEPGTAAGHYFLCTAFNHAGIDLQMRGDVARAAYFSEQAMQELEKCARASDFDRFYMQAFVHALLARFYFDRGRLAEAEERLRAAQRSRLAHTPQVIWQVCLVRGQMAAQQGKLDLALIFLRHALRFSPKSAEIRPILASVILIKGKQDERLGMANAYGRACAEAIAILRAVPADHPAAGQAQRLLTQIQRDAAAGANVPPAGNIR